MADAEHYVREDVRAFLDMLEAMGGDGIEVVGAQAGREQMKAMKHLAEADAPDLAIKRDLVCPGPAGDIPLRLYDVRDTRTRTPVVVFYHGGGFVIGDLDTHDHLCAEIAHRLDLPVVAVDYRLAPEHPFPAAPDDCEAATRWVAGSPDGLGYDVAGLVLTGDSAGGNLAIVTTNQLMNEPADAPVLVQAPIYPVATETDEHDSFSLFGEGFLLSAAGMNWFHEQYAGDTRDPRHTPILGDCSRTPPTVICTAGLDPLRDSGREYAAHLIQLGVEVSYFEFPGQIHGFVALRKAIPSGQADLEAFLGAIRIKLDRIAA